MNKGKKVSKKSKKNHQKIQKIHEKMYLNFNITALASLPIVVFWLGNEFVDVDEWLVDWLILWFTSWIPLNALNEKAETLWQHFDWPTLL